MMDIIKTIGAIWLALSIGFLFGCFWAGRARNISRNPVATKGQNRRKSVSRTSTEVRDRVCDTKNGPIVNL